MADTRERLESGRKIAQLLRRDKKSRLNGIVLGKVLRDPPVVEGGFAC
ncbi:MAG: hypothetical protein GY859_43815 [Desulfobacterales bacterium]|nr:hypothetical protein [Desulfobacterales bacterium]